MFVRYSNVVMKNGDVLHVKFKHSQITHHNLTQCKDGVFIFENIFSIEYTGQVDILNPIIHDRILVPIENVYYVIETKSLEEKEEEV